MIYQVSSYFKDKKYYEEFIIECQNKYDIRIYRLNCLSILQAKKIYQQIKDKYMVEKLYKIAPTSWYEGERRLFIWAVLCYRKYLQIKNQPFTQEHWQILSETFFSKKIIFLKYQYKNILRSKRRVKWCSQQDYQLKEAVKQHKLGQWNQIAKELYFKTEQMYFKTPKQCRERWFNHLNEQINKNDWNESEDELIIKQVEINGNKWAKISQIIGNGRTENMIKNRYNWLKSHENKQKSKQNKKIRKQKISIQTKQQQTILKKQQIIKEPLKISSFIEKISNIQLKKQNEQQNEIENISYQNKNQQQRDEIKSLDIITMGSIGLNPTNFNINLHQSGKINYPSYSPLNFNDIKSPFSMLSPLNTFTQWANFIPIQNQDKIFSLDENPKNIKNQQLVQVSTQFSKKIQVEK